MGLMMALTLSSFGKQLVIKVKTRMYGMFRGVITSTIQGHFYLAILSSTFGNMVEKSLTAVECKASLLGVDADGMADL